MADYTRQGDPWINDGPPDIDADALTEMEDGILDAVTHHKHAPIAERPPASAENKNWLWIAPDGPLAVSNGVEWLEGAAPGGVAPRVAVPFPYAAGWAELGAPFAPAEYSVGSDGLVVLQGTVLRDGPDAPSGTVIGSLPIGTRPSGTILGFVRGFVWNTYLSVRVDIGLDGEIVNQEPIGATSWFTLNFSYVRA